MKGEIYRYGDWFLHQEHYHALLEEAEQWRLLNVGRAKPPGRPRRLQNLANWVGRQMVAWGYRLQSPPVERRIPVTWVEWKRDCC